MIRRRRQLHPRHSERGVTMLLVVVAMLSMLGIMALAIDVITLYSARSETQRAADAAALAAAKMLVDMGVTTDPTATVPTAAQIDAATKAAQGVAGNTVIGGRTVQTADVTLTFPGGGTTAFNVNPQVTVTVQNTNLPTFFSRIWSRAALTVRASATAEGYNPSNATSITGGATAPVVARCVKPFIVPNCDPDTTVHPVPPGPPSGCVGATTLFDPTTGAITNHGAYPGGIIGEGFDLVSDCGTGPGCGAGVQGTPKVSVGPTLQYYPAQMSGLTSTCPSCTGATDFEQAIECCDPTPISCGTTVTAPAVNQLSVDATVFPEGGSGPAQSGVECLIHQTGGSGMDSLNKPLTYPLQIVVGNGHPLNGSVLAANDLVTTSDSLVTVPVFNGAAAPGAGSVNIIGFLQVFIDGATPGGGPNAGRFHVTVVNVSGCGSSATGTAVASGGAVPVRLIQ
jgi:Flp pilus assembly protein TadG